MTYNFTEEYDIIVIGAGHAGVEASLAASRMGCLGYQREPAETKKK